MIKSADDRLRGLQEALELDNQLISSLRQRVSPEKAKEAVKIIDQSVEGLEDGVKITVEQATARANAAAQATGDAEIVTFVEEVTATLNEKLLIGQELGILEEGISGYFPIVNANQWRLELVGIDAEAQGFAGFHATRKEALAEVQKAQTLNPKVTGEITPAGLFFEDAGLIRLTPKQLNAQRKALVEAFSETFGPEEARAAAEVSMKQRFGLDVPGRTTFGGARQRKLGIRDYSKDPYEALESYFSGFQRSAAFNNYEREATQVLQQLGLEQGNLKAWGEQFIADMLGKPRPVEKAVQATLEHLGLDPKPRALRRVSTLIRKVESSFRLGGFMSGIVNLSQIALNTNTVLGPKWTARGFEALDPTKYKGIVNTLKTNGLDLGHFMPLTEEGLISHYGGVGAAVKEKRFFEALHRMSLFVFNGAEKTNRLVTAWGAFQREIAAGAEPKIAAMAAEEIVKRTQFNYRLSNTPEILRSPVGAVALQFKSFVVNELDFIASLTEKEFVAFTSSLAALGGVSLMLNMPGGEMVDNASLAFSNKKVSETIRLTDKGNPLTRFALFGVPGLFNVDLSDFVGIGSVSDITSSLFGPAISDATATAKFIVDGATDFTAGGSVRDETKDRFLQQVMPSAIRRALRGKDIFDTGEVRSPYSGKLLYKPEARMREAFATGIGIPSLRLQEERAADIVTTRATTNYRNTYTSYAKEAAESTRQGNSEASRQVLREAKAAGYNISSTSLNYWIRELSKTGAQRRRSRLPTVLREDLSELYEATGQFQFPR